MVKHSVEQAEVGAGAFFHSLVLSRTPAHSQKKSEEKREQKTKEPSAKEKSGNMGFSALCCMTLESRFQRHQPANNLAVLAVLF
jgi:hypothetical protein